MNLELVEARAFADLYRSAPKALGFSCVESDERVAFFAPAVDILILNRVIELKTSTGEALEPIVARFRELGLKGFGVQLMPDLESAPMLATLERLHLRKRDAWTRFSRNADAAPEVTSDFVVEQIGPVGFVEFGRVACEGLGMPVARTPFIASTVGEPNWLHYLVYDGHTAVATAAMFIHERIGWLGLAATLPSHRGRGIQNLLLSRRIADGIQAGCTGFTAETAPSGASARNMVPTGFAKVCDRPNYMANS